MALSRRLQADLWIVLLSAIWGGTFVVLKRVLDDISPLTFVAVRFIVAAVPMYVLVPRGALRGGPDRASGDGGSRRAQAGVLAGGAVTGLFLFLGFATQTIGIQYTTPARSAFITGMYLIFTPVLSIMLGLRRPSVDSLVGVGLATLGLALLTNPAGGGSGFGLGEGLTLICAVAFAAHLLAVDHYTRRHDKRAIAFLQVAVVGLLAAPCAAAFETVRLVPTRSLLFGLLVTSILCTAVAFFILNAVQSWTTPTRAAIIFAAEPVFAAVTSYLVEGEVLGAAALAGAGLILAGMLTAELTPFGRRRRSQAEAA